MTSDRSYGPCSIKGASFTPREIIFPVSLMPIIAGRQIPVTVNEMLLRGCTLRNTGHILGLVVYTGVDSRIQMNAAKTPNKVGEDTNSSQ